MLTQSGQTCLVVALSKVPQKSDARVKTDRRDIGERKEVVQIVRLDVDGLDSVRPGICLSLGLLPILAPR